MANECRTRVHRARARGKHILPRPLPPHLLKQLGAQSTRLEHALNSHEEQEERKAKLVELTAGFEAARHDAEEAKTSLAEKTQFIDQRSPRTQ